MAATREEELVESWRLDQLLRGGYPVWAAEKLAARPDVDLHQALELVERGCPAEIATRILL